MQPLFPEHNEHEKEKKVRKDLAAKRYRLVSPLIPNKSKEKAAALSSLTSPLQQPTDELTTEQQL